ncbi:MAG: hypothetical protein KAU29_00310 [Gammaproteobacteria bacterium]|nr:hypothetical protein [Gammaproteobacteria bacterium]
MKLTLITLLYLTSSHLQASEYSKFCFNLVKEENRYQATVNNTKKFTLFDFMQTCINGVGYLEKDNIIRIYKNEKQIQLLKINFNPNNSTIACISYNKKQNTWVSGFASIGEGSCEFNR